MLRSVLLVGVLITHLRGEEEVFDYFKYTEFFVFMLISSLLRICGPCKIFQLIDT